MRDSHRPAVHLLGSLEVREDGRTQAIRAGKQRALLATLATAPGRAVPVGTIMDRLWEDEAPPAAGTTIRGYVKRLRRVLDSRRDRSLIQNTGAGYRLDITAADTDVGQFTDLVRRADAAGDHDTARGLLDRALALWRGPALADVPSDSLCAELVPSLTELRLQAVQKRNELCLAGQVATEVIPDLHRLVAEHPLEEKLWGQLIRALCRAGRPAAALEQYEACRTVLSERLGVDPCAQLRDLHRRILTRDASLVA